MIKKLLSIFMLLLLGQIINAQTDEANDATPILASTTYECENEELGNFEGFTKSAEFTCAGPEYADWVDAWYEFTPVETRIFAIEIESTNSSDFDVRLAIYSGTPNNLNGVSTGCATRYASNTLNEGETYYINVRGALETTGFRLCIYPFPSAPSNDEPANADTLVESTFDVCENPSTGYTTNATFTSESICSTSNPDVWYSFTPSETAEYTFRADLINGATPLYIGVYSGTPGFLNAFVEEPTSPTLQCSDIVLADLNAGETYYISVTSPGSSQAIYFNLCTYKSPAAPENDDCTNPRELTVGATFENSYIVATTTSGTVNPENSNFPSCGTLPDFGIYGRDVWFTVTVPASGNFTVETRIEPTEDHLNDTAMEAYTGSCGTETLIPFYYSLPPNPDDYCSNQFIIGGTAFAGMNFVDKTPGETVIIRVWGWAYQFGKFRIGAYDTTLSTNDFDTRTLNYFPNPINEVLNISYKENINNVVVRNLLGKTIISRETNNSNVELDVSGVASGMYIVTLHSGNSTTTFKIVKE